MQSSALDSVTLLEVSREENRAAWEAARRNFIGSSEIATVMQVSKWQTPLELWCERTGKVEHWQPSRAARYGTKVEAKILELFAEDHPELEVIPNVGTYVSKKFPHAAATPDSFTIRRADNDLGITEVKHQGFGFDEWGQDKAPTDAHIQTVWQMGVLGVAWGFITAIVGGRANDVIEPRFEFDATARAIFEQCIEKAAAFLRCVQTDTPPGAGPGKRSKSPGPVGQRGARAGPRRCARPGPGALGRPSGVRPPAAPAPAGRPVHGA